MTHAMNSRSPTASSPARASTPPAAARAALRLLERLEHGHLRIELPDGTPISYGALRAGTGRIANRLDFGGVNFATDAACASSLSALQIALHELRACLAQAESELTGGLSPRVLPMGEIRDLGGLLQRAGFALPVADSFTKTVQYRDALHLMRDLRAMGEGNALMDRLRRPTRRAVFARAAMLYAQTHALPDGRIKATFEIIGLAGWAPHESQQKPLRPGSAAARLADALNAAERPLSRGNG